MFLLDESVLLLDEFMLLLAEFILLVAEDDPDVFLPPWLLLVLPFFVMAFTSILRL